jgi:hypothetical protein
MPIERLISGGIIPRIHLMKGKYVKKFEQKNAVWEDWETINLLWYDKENNRYEFVFGKRAPFYYKCELECSCFWQGHREFFLDKEKIFSWGNKSRKFTKKSWEKMFEAKDCEGRGTVVIEEKEGRINFYSKLKPIRKETKYSFQSKVSFVIVDDTGVECPRPQYKQKRPCAEHPRISYVTYRPPSLVSKNNISVSSFEENWNF